MKITNPCLDCGTPIDPSFDRCRLHHRVLDAGADQAREREATRDHPGRSPNGVDSPSGEGRVPAVRERYRPVDIADRLRLPDDLVRGCIAKLREKPTKKVKGKSARRARYSQRSWQVESLD